MNYTKGPWEVDALEVRTMEGFIVAEVNMFASSFDDGIAQKNAALIAAAPTMYEALNKAIETIQWAKGTKAPVNFQYTCEDLLKLFQETLALAEGRSEE